MPKSKRHYPRLKRKTHRNYRGGAALAIAPKYIDRQTQKGCSSGGWFSSATPKGCTSSEAVIKSVTAFYNESVVNAKNPIDYVESKRWLKEILGQYISGQGTFQDTAQPSSGMSMYGQQQSPPPPFGRSSYPPTAMQYNPSSSGYGSTGSGYGSSGYGSSGMGSSGMGSSGSSGYDSGNTMYGGLPKK